MKNYILLAVFWALFFMLHSLLADDWLKNLVRKKFNNYYKFYRLGFNFVSVILFLIIVFFQFSLEKLYIFKPTIFTFSVGLLFIVSGIIAMFFSLKSFNTKEFIGIQQLKKLNHKSNVTYLSKKGFYGLVRHPLYFATILLILGVLVYLPTYANAIFFLVVIVYLPIGIYLEEKKLIKEFGDEYKQYQKEVKSVIPYLF